jgi:hypothetical protein
VISPDLIASYRSFSIRNIRTFVNARVAAFPDGFIDAFPGQAENRGEMPTHTTPPLPLLS